MHKKLFLKKYLLLYYYDYTRKTAGGGHNVLVKLVLCHVVKFFSGATNLITFTDLFKLFVDPYEAKAK